jgi:phosphopantetheinyl transferase (holo-ACP synthase)
MVVGIDLVEDRRINALSSSERARIFLPEDPKDKLPSVFALREAAIKACGVPMARIQVRYDGPIPRVSVEGFELFASVSHEAGLTIAIVTGSRVRSTP